MHVCISIYLSIYLSISVVQQVMALLRAFSAAPVDFAAETRIRETAVRAPAELLKAVVPRYDIDR